MISLKNVSKSYQGGTEILTNIQLEIKDKELLVLLGESGSGKTTLLKMLNRLVDCSAGSIEINGSLINSLDSIQLRRKMGYVVQQTGLFPHMTVKENIDIVCKINGFEKNEIEQRTSAVMKMVGLDPNEFFYRYPKELSGGQAQRVGVARAYVTNPEVILMDEPFSALDPITRNELQNELIKLQNKYPKTIVFVTHDIAEAIKLADRIVLLNEGVIEQIGTPRELLLNPKSEYVSKFLGEKRVWKSPWLLKCKDVMSNAVTCVDINEKIENVWEIIKNDSVQAILVTDKNDVILGKLTEKIMMRNMSALSIEQAMKTNFDFAYEDTPLHDAVKMMNEKDVLYLPVVNDQMKLKGILSMTDLLAVFDDNILSETMVM